MTQFQVEKLYLNNNYISYRQFNPVNFFKPSILFLSGYNSNMNATKAQALKEYCISKNISITCFDYLGTGESSGNFNDYTLSDWLQNTLTIIDQIMKENIIIIGSSMGGWLMLHAALQRPKKVKALIGIASALNFTKEIIWAKLSFFKKMKFQFQDHLYYKPAKDKNEALFFTKKFFNDSEKLLLKKQININCPTRLIHGSDDKIVPFQTSIKLLSQLNSLDATLDIVKNGDHNLYTLQNLQLIYKKLEEILNLF